jgi:UDP-4-amino-4,6-dideoxy-N-acetyl-beta-L-altrosamine transaminase
MSYIPYGRQSISQADITAVVEVLRSDFLTQGPCVPAFEKTIADYCGATHAVAVNSATSALHVACLALGVGPGDLVWTSPITFVASANCALYCGAKVDFVDIDPHTYNLGIESLRTKLAEADANGTLPKVVIPVHFCGQSCDMQALFALSEQYGFKVIEDASHAIGGCYQNKPIGDCRYSDITIFSFHPVKIITTAEGGIATCKSADLAQRMRLLRSHGITRDESLMTRTSDGPWCYQQIDLGFNFRMTDMQAALGVSQLSRLDNFVARRHELAARYDEQLATLPITLPWQHTDTYSSFHLYVVRLQLDRIERSHREVFEALHALDIGVNLHYIPVYLQPYYIHMGFTPGYCPQAEAYYAEAISLPLFPDMSDMQQEQVITALKTVLAP